MTNGNLDALNRAAHAVLSDIRDGRRPLAGDLSFFRSHVIAYMEEATRTGNPRNRRHAESLLARVNEAVERMDREAERDPAEFRADLIATATAELKELEDDLDDATSPVAVRSIKQRIAAVRKRIADLNAMAGE